MPRPKRKNPVHYQRGPYSLKWDRKSDGSLRSPHLAIFWYDRGKRGVRSHSTGEADLDAAIRATDRFYVERTEGLPYCPTCGQLRHAQAGYLLVDAIETYLLMAARHRSSGKAIEARLNHVLAYLGTLPDAGVPCEAVDELWIQAFRDWAIDQPIVSPTGKVRLRAAATVEASVAQLSAAINDAEARKNTLAKSRFKSIPFREVNRSPQFRADVRKLAEMFRYCMAPAPIVVGSWTDEVLAQRIRERAALLRFLRASVATWARPDSVHDISTDPKRRQWHGQARVLDLNPDGRRQTKKYRPILPVPRQFAPHLDEADGYYVGPRSIDTAWDTMAAELRLPRSGQSGPKLIRRSVSHIARGRLGEERWVQGQIFLGHHKASTSDIYALFDPANLGRALEVTEAIIDEIEALTPGAFSRSIAGEVSNVVPIGGPKR